MGFGTSAEPLVVNEKSDRVWSSYQDAIFDQVSNGDGGHTFVAALAGTGKTTTLEECLSLGSSERTRVAFAFNKAIATELQARIGRRALWNVQAATLHSFGFATLRGAFRAQVKVDGYKSNAIVDDVYFDGREPTKREDAETGDHRAAIVKLVSLAKGYLVPLEEQREDEALDQLDQILDQHEIDPTRETSNDPETDRELAIQTALFSLRKSAEMTHVIDFDDMVWMPVVRGLRCRQSDGVFVDEAQDLNPCQIELFMRALRPGGRATCFGDKHQAIYRFRGADSRAVQVITERLGARTMSLPVTYRCAKAIVRVANEVVPELQAAPGAPEGIVDAYHMNGMMKNARGGDFILSRSNAALVGPCLAFLRDGRPAKIAGRDIGARLLAVVKKARAKTIEALIVWIEEWRSRECKRLQLRKPPMDTQAIDDTAACILTLCEGLKTVDQVKDRLSKLFSDNTDDEKTIVLSTTHKAKGLERDRVFVLKDTYRKRPGEEEQNLWYVAVTRARRELYMVATPRV